MKLTLSQLLDQRSRTYHPDKVKAVNAAILDLLVTPDSTCKKPGHTPCNK